MEDEQAINPELARRLRQVYGLPRDPTSMEDYYRHSLSGWIRRLHRGGLPVHRAHHRRALGHRGQRRGQSHFGNGGGVNLTSLNHLT